MSGSQDRSCRNPTMQLSSGETMMSADQSPKATAALPRVAVPPRSQHPVSWFERHGIEEEIGDS